MTSAGSRALMLKTVKHARPSLNPGQCECTWGVHYMFTQDLTHVKAWYFTYVGLVFQVLNFAL